jgi:hypothetical protein
VELAKTPTNAATQTIYKIVTGIRPAHRDKPYYSTLYYLFIFEIFSGETGSNQRKRLFVKEARRNCLTSLDESRLNWFEGVRRFSDTRKMNIPIMATLKHHAARIRRTSFCSSPLPNFSVRKSASVKNYER